MRALLLVWLILISNTALAYWDCHWPFRTPVTISASAAVPNNYQVRININNDLHAGYNWSDAGNDLRVLDSDDNSELDFWIDRWDATNKSASVWVRFPTLTTNNRTIYLYYGNKAATPITQVPPVFTYGGIRFHTRNTSADPRNYNDAVSAFESAPDGRSGYGCKFITNFTNITNANQFPPGGSDFGARSESYFEVKPGEAGFWEFRYGSDFGRGGGLFINSTPLEEQWNDDLWWNNSWSNSDVLQGGISLTAGYHKLEVLGFEGCCDGGITVQFKKPGGSWQTFTTGNIDIRSAACPVSTNIAFGAHEVCEADLLVRNFGDNTNQSQAPDLWVVDSARQVLLKTRNNGPKATLPDTNLTISLANNLALDGYSGNSWNCSGSLGQVECRYSGTVSANSAFPDLALQVKATSDTPSTAALSVSIEGKQYDSNPNNNNRNANRSVRRLIMASGLAPGCSSTPGLLTGYFDTRNSPNNYADNAAEFDAMESSFATDTYLYGQTLLSEVNGSGNPFGSSEEYMTLFDGYILLEQDGDYRFAVNGDDAIELSLRDNNDTSYIAAWYGAHGATSGANTSATVLAEGFAQGYYRFRFRHQEYQGGDSYEAYWRRPGDSGYSLIPASQFVNCNATQNIELVTTTNVISDPINSSNFKAIPGAEVRYQVTARNNGTISTDLNSTVLIQAIDDGSEFLVGSLTFSDGTGNSRSGLQLTPASNISLEYLNASNAVITPASAGTYDPAIRSIRMRFNGTFQAKFGSLTPEFSYQYQIRLQ